MRVTDVQGAASHDLIRATPPQRRQNSGVRYYFVKILVFKSKPRLRGPATVVPAVSLLKIREKHKKILGSVDAPVASPRRHGARRFAPRLLRLAPSSGRRALL
ncbi:unnamed protein product [Euphydryas editha]|uniref:Uncharacterized protein n=1 Tax=Euphydryas editha TaxID=104508 RepID=A0AAU9UU88_EUPED|nr:unnamed protein product [Euphydryas editha]